MAVEKRRVECSVLTSSSLRDLPDLFSELAVVCGQTVFDLMILRDVDVVSIERSSPLRPAWYQAGSVLDNRRITDIIADKTNRTNVTDWIVKRVRPKNVPTTRAPALAMATYFIHWIVNRFRRRKVDAVRIPALATYFPDVTSISDERRKIAVDALANTLKIAIALKQKGLMTDAIVEMVCGTVLDACACSRCRDGVEGGRVFVSTRNDKLHLLQESLEEVVTAVKDQYPSERFGLGLELEPGDTYVFNGPEFENVMRCVREPSLRPHVGLNLDIAHMRIAGIPSASVECHVDLITNGHIADHPGSHTRDQPIGDWSPIWKRDGELSGFVSLLRQAGEQADAGRVLPFSYGLAIELEGCNRIEWIYQCICATNHLLALAYGR